MNDNYSNEDSVCWC